MVYQDISYLKKNMQQLLFFSLCHFVRSIYIDLLDLGWCWDETLRLCGLGSFHAVTCLIFSDFGISVRCGAKPPSTQDPLHCWRQKTHRDAWKMNAEASAHHHLMFQTETFQNFPRSDFTQCPYLQSFVRCGPHHRAELCILSQDDAWC